MITLLQIGVTIAIFTYVFWEWTNSAKYRWRPKESVRFPGRPPNWLFGPAWFVFKSLIVASWLTWLFGPFESTVKPGIWLAHFIVQAVNELLRKAWTPAAADLNRPRLALVINVLIVSTGLALVILLGIVDAWLPFGLLLPYVIWTIYALYLNGWYVYLKEDMVKLYRKLPKPYGTPDWEETRPVELKCEFNRLKNQKVVPQHIKLIKKV